MSSITFIRHGQASIDGTNYDLLSDLGVRQAEILGDYFAAIGRSFDAVYSGALQRQIGTAQAMLSHMANGNGALACLTHSAFDEFDAFGIVKTLLPTLIEEDPLFGDVIANAGQDLQAKKILAERALRSWVSGRYDAPENETWRDVVRRVRKGIQEITALHEPRAKLAVVTSGGPICAVLQLALEMTDECAVRQLFSIRNASVTVVSQREERLHLRSFNSAAHLEMQCDARLLTYV